MTRTIALSLVLAPTTLACAATVPPSTAAEAERAPDTPPVAIDYRIVRGEANGGVVLAGRTQVDARHSAIVESSAGRSSATEQLRLDALPGADGSVFVEVMYNETSPEGDKLHWMPAVRLERGVTSHAEVSGDGWSRAIELTAR
jgi:hypothetical protein